MKYPKFLSDDILIYLGILYIDRILKWKYKNENFNNEKWNQATLKHVTMKITTMKPDVVDFSAKNEKKMGVTMANLHFPNFGGTKFKI